MGEDCGASDRGELRHEKYLCRWTVTWAGHSRHETHRAEDRGGREGPRTHPHRTMLCV
jgi:hypothetical protein